MVKAKRKTSKRQVSRDNLIATTGGFRISDKKAKEARARILKRKKSKRRK